MTKSIIEPLLLNNVKTQTVFFGKSRAEKTFYIYKNILFFYTH